MVETKNFKWVLFLLLISLHLFGQNSDESSVVTITINNKNINLYEESHALIIGVNEYTNGWPNLPGVVLDISEIKEALESQGFNVEVVQNGTKTQIDSKISSFISRYGQKPDNRLLFYFAGHGYTVRTSYGDELGYIVPTDAPNPNIDKAGFQAKAIEMVDFEKYAKRIQSKHALFLFDSCFSGSLFALSRAVPEIIGYKTQMPVRQFITSGSADETVPDRSIFREQFVISVTTSEADANGDGYLTGSELGEFLQDRVVNYSYNTQHPQYGKIRNTKLDKGDFVFVTPENEDLNPEYLSFVETETDRNDQERFEVDSSFSVTPNRAASKNYGSDYRSEEETLTPLPKKLSTSVSMKNGIQIEWVEIPSGTFKMGSPFSELGRQDDEKQQVVTVNEYKISKYPITFDQYDAFCEVTNRPKPDDKGWGRGKMPVINVSWHEAKAFAEWMGGRLPTEAEWELAGRAGSQTPFNTGEFLSLKKANFDVNEVSYNNFKIIGKAKKRTVPVGQYEPNTWGIYDMHGNVLEWCENSYSDLYRNSALPDNASKVYKSLRGGSWKSPVSQCRSAARYSYPAAGKSNTIGFRIVRD